MIGSLELTPERLLLLDSSEPTRGSLVLTGSRFGMPVGGVLRVLMCIVCWCCGLPSRMWVGGRGCELVETAAARWCFMSARLEMQGLEQSHETNALTFV